MASQTPHTTNVDDLVVKGVSRIFHDCLPANTNNSNKTKINHEFVEAYLRGSSSGNKISSDFGLVAEDLIKHLPKNLSAEGRISTSIETKGYVHESLYKMWAFVQDRKTWPKTIDDEACLALTAFSFIYTIWGEPCRTRGLGTAIEWLSICDQRWRFPERPGRSIGDCFHLSSHLAPVTLIEILDRHPECKWTKNQLLEKLSSGLTARTIEFIKDPKFAPSNR